MIRNAASLIAPFLASLAMGVGAHAQDFGKPSPFLQETPKEIDGLTIEDRLGEPVPMDLEFTDSTGRTVTLGDCALDGRPMLLQMVYLRCPLLCPRSTEELIDSLNEISLDMGEDYSLVLVTFDPRDSTDDVRFYRDVTFAQYAKSSSDSAKQGLRVLTATPDNAQTLADSIGFQYRYLPKSGEYSHGTAVFVVTPDANLSRTITGLSYPSRDLKIALLEAGDGKIGTTFDLIWMSCFQLDPDTGTYVLAAYRFMQFSGVLCAVVLGSFISFLVVRDRQRRARALSQSPAPATVALTGTAR